MRVSLALFGLVASTAPPTIELDLDESAVHTRLNKHNSRYHKTSRFQPDGKAVFGRQDYTQTCAANLKGVHVSCKLPRARAYDHVDGKSVAVRKNIWLIDMDGKKQMRKVKKVSWTKRSTYLFKYDATDRAGNHAEQVVFALRLDDETKPTIQMCGKKSVTVEAATTKIVPAKNWKLCQSVVTDNIDTSASMTIKYTVSHDGKFILRNKSFREAQKAITTRKVGKFTITMVTHDNAKKYGVSRKNNYKTATKVVTVQDTTAPWITITGAVPAVNECAIKYTDAGAVGHDALDTLDNKLTMPVKVANKVNIAVVGQYSVCYDTTDLNKNVAPQVCRGVQIEDTTKPKIALVGEPQVVHYSEDKIVDGGVTSSDTCDKVMAPFTSAWNKPFNDRKLGEYIRTYTVIDASKNTISTARTFDIQDNKIPEITVQGHEVMTFEATHDKVYTDQGAICRDYVDGILDHAVEVSGDDVSLKVPAVYTIYYNCRDLTGNKAIQLKRTVTVQDTTAPTLSLLGAQQYYIEAGFPYVDAGATATDTLDGDITKKIGTSGDTVNVENAFYSRRSCKDIKENSKVTLKSGSYYITTLSPRTKTWGRRRVTCDMTEKAPNTYYKCRNCKRVVPYGTDHGSCANRGLEMLKFRNKSERKVATKKFGVNYVPVNRKATTDDYICSTNDRYLPAGSWPTGMHSFAPTHDEITRKENGKYVIAYHVSDKAGNKQAKIIRRTVTVKDTLPPVITLTLKNKLIHTSKTGQKTPKVGFDKVYINPAGVSGLNPNFMVESATSVNGWVIGAVASAVAGVALLGLSTKSTQVSVPV